MKSYPTPVNPEIGINSTREFPLQHKTFYLIEVFEGDELADWAVVRDKSDTILLKADGDQFESEAYHVKEWAIGNGLTYKETEYRI